jgi:Arc/MetJ family transcription regulator
MRTNIEIDDKLMKKAMKASLLEKKTKKAVVEEALALMVKIRERAEGLRQLRGKVHWEGNLDELRTSKHLPPETEQDKAA